MKPTGFKRGSTYTLKLNINFYFPSHFAVSVWLSEKFASVGRQVGVSSCRHIEGTEMQDGRIFYSCEDIQQITLCKLGKKIKACISNVHLNM